MKIQFIAIIILTCSLMGFAWGTFPPPQVAAQPLSIAPIGPNNPIPNPVTNSHTAALTSTVSISYNQPLKPSSVTSRTFAVQAKQSGGLLGSLTVQENKISLTPARPFKAGELVQASATTATVNLADVGPAKATVWQFRTVTKKSSGLFADSGKRFNSLTNNQLINIGDFNQDGLVDMLIGDVIWLNNGATKFSDKGYRLGYGGATAIDFGDVDGDGDLDALVAMPTSTASAAILGSQIWLNTGSGQFSKSSAILSFSYDGVLADLDGDGDMDALLGQMLWLNNGTATFTSSSQIFGSANGAVAAGDLDNDGDLDAVIGYPSNQNNQIWLNDGRGVFSSSGVVGQVASSKILLDNLNNDPFLDIFLIEPTLQQDTAWLNNGQAQFGTLGEQIRDSVINTLALGDLEGDGDLDFFLARSANQIDQTWFNEGNGNFIGGPQMLGNTDSRAVALGDLDGDGDLDAVVGNFNQPSQIWLNGALPDITVQQGATVNGNLIHYTITASNIGVAVANGAILIDQLPTNTELVSFSVPHYYDPIAHAVNVTLAEMNPQTELKFSLTVRLMALPAETTHLSNMITVTLADDADKSNNSNGYSFMPQVEANLVISNSNNKTMLRPSEIITYTVTLFNNSGREAANITLTNQLPTLMTLIAASEGVTMVNRQVTWQIDRLAAGQTVTRLITLQLNNSLPAGTDFLTDTAIVTYTANPFTSAVTVKQAIDADVVAALFDLMLTQSDERNMVYSNDLLTYTLTLNNNGTQDATEVSLTDTLPEMVEFLVASGGGVWANQTVTWSGLNIAAQDSLTKTVQVRVLTPTVGPINITNTAIVKATLPDPTPNNNISIDVNIVKIAGSPRLTLELSGPSLAQVGETIIYTMMLTHAAESSQSPVRSVNITSNLSQPIYLVTGDDALDLAESWLYTSSYVVQLNNPPSLTNRITVQGLDLNNDPVTVSRELTTTVPIIRISKVTMSGLISGDIGLTYTFMATVTPTNATLPLSYIWQANDQTSLIHNNRYSLSDTVEFTWETVGVRQVTVNVINGNSVAEGRFTFTVRGPDTPPTIRNVLITPNPPKDDDNLDLFYTYTDSEGDLEGNTQIQWTVNGQARPDLNKLTTTVAANLTQPEESWCAIITPLDFKGVAGMPTAPNCVTIANNPFVCQAKNVELLSLIQNSTLPRLKLNYTVTCPQRELAQADIRWYRDGVFQPGLNDQTEVLSDLVVAREAWTATVAACSENNGCERAITSNVVYVTEKPNTPPVATVSLTPTSPLDRDNLTLKMTIYDADNTPKRQGQNQTQIRWYRDGTLNPAFNNQNTLIGSETYAGETWCVVVQPYDGLDYGTVTEPVCVAIGSTDNHAPQMSNLTLGATRQKQGNPLILSYEYQDVDKDNELPALHQIRWYRNGQLQPAFNNQMQVTALSTLAGEVWSAKVRVYDGKLYGAWVKSSAVNITNENNNTPPVAQEITLKSTADQNLKLNYIYGDVDGHQEKNTLIYWYNNPFTRTPEFDGLTVIPAAKMKSGEIWYARVIPQDGLAYGQTAVAHSVRAFNQTNSPPEVLQLLLTPATPDDELRLLYIYYDPDGDAPGKSQIKWTYKDLVQNSFADTSVVPGDFIHLGDKWCAFVTPVDSPPPGTAGETKSVCKVIGEAHNTLPEITGKATIEPAIARDDQSLTLKYTYFDADGDEEGNSQIRWYKINSTTGGANELQELFNDKTFVPASATFPGEQWYATVLVHDGKNYSEVLQKTEPVFINHPPQATDLKLAPDNARASQRIRIVYTFTDVDTNTINSTAEIHWFRNGQHQADHDDATSFPEGITEYNDTLSVTLRPHDGLEYGNMMTTSIKIGPPPGPIYLPLLIKIVRPIDPTPTNTPTATPTPPPCSPQSRYEPNDSRPEACETTFNSWLEQSYPDDIEDIYYFVLTETHSVKVEVNNYRPNTKAGWLQVYNQFDNKLFLAQVDPLEGTGVIPNSQYPNGLKNLPPGIYYIRVYTYLEAVNPTVPYKLQVVVVQ